MNVIKTVKIKDVNGNISEETYVLTADAVNILMSNGYELQETIGNIDVDEDGSIAAQLAELTARVAALEEEINGNSI